MKEYRIQGLSCANCAKELEQEIHKLEQGHTAKILYNSGKLKIDQAVDLQAVKKILASDGAALVQEASAVTGSTHLTEETGSDHTHEHGSEGGKWKLLLSLSTVIFLTLIIFESQLSSYVAIPGYILATAISGYATFVKGLKNLIRLKFNINTLMTIALVGAFSIGEWKEGTLVAILFGLNEYLEGLGMEKARRSMAALLDVAPKQATVLIGNQEQVVPVEQLQVADVVLVRAGEKIPSDGIVLSGTSSVNEAAITGESMPVDKVEGESVFGGSINNEGVLRVTITKAYEESSLSKILHLVEEAQETKTPTEQFINRFAQYYTPLIMVISAIVMLFPPLFFGGDWGTWLYQGLAVLIVGCPCALILSSPIAIVSGITVNARNGILIKGGVFLEQLGKIDTIAFDKTGTLTKGEPHVQQWQVYDAALFSVAAAIESTSSHPIAKAVMNEVQKHDVNHLEATQLKTIAGQGVTAIIHEQRYFVGNEALMTSLNIPSNIQQVMDHYKAQGWTLVIVADEQHILGLFGIADETREESKQVISNLHHVGIKQTVMLTGDHQMTAEKVAQQVGVSAVYAGLLPEQKVEKMKELAKKGKVAMIGDGINDAPALATADLGIAMGKGTDSAIETADIVLMQDHLGKLPAAVSISRNVNRIIKFNIVFSLALKAFALLLTIPGVLTLWIAILADMGATIFVTLVSLTVLIESKKEKEVQLQRAD
ncbi:heavy metal translocating P-type ATPase [Longirhabdus pacifica]|uniref:heavy metal translocating P-type ATPase n=1 Tax=Longirhabdus pacifica TaxID=2305227 RepID=UPI00100890B0|nr:cation-translocating P-type ATPase [Longirhabdus pacifica]